MRGFNLLFVFIIVVAASCRTQKQSINNYLQHTSDTTIKDLPAQLNPVIQKNDLLVHHRAGRYAYTVVRTYIHFHGFHVLVLIKKTPDGLDLLFLDNGGLAVPVNKIHHSVRHTNIGAVFLADFHKHIGFEERLFNGLNAVAPLPSYLV